MSVEDWDNFTTAISSGLTASDEPLRLDPEAERELQEKLDELARCRARALIDAQSYVFY